MKFNKNILPGKTGMRFMPLVLLRVLPLAVLILFVVWFGARWASMQTVRDEVSKSLEAYTVQSAETISANLGKLEENITLLASNDLIINSLVDMTARMNYLPTFFRSLQLPGSRSAAITLMDYRGRIIVSNTQNSAEGFEEAPWLTKIMQGGDLFHFSGSGLMIVKPVFYSGMAEGAIVVQYDEPSVAALLKIESREFEYAVLHNTKGALASSFSDLSRTISQSDTGESGWLFFKKEIPGYDYLTLIYAIEKKTAYSQLFSLERFLIIAMIVDLAALVLGIALSAQTASRPLSVFINTIQKVRESGKFSEMPLMGSREFQELAQAFNTYGIELKIVQNELLSKAIESGRTQLSAMVLHNIGNAVTPVQVTLDTMEKKNSGKAVEYLSRCYEALEKNKNDLGNYITEHPKGVEIFKYMGELIRHMKETGDECGRQFVKIRSAIDYISEILTFQQNYAAGTDVAKESLDLNRILDDAFKMQGSALDRRGIRVEKSFSKQMPLMAFEKNKLMQVIVNFIKNSYEAVDMLQNSPAERKITVKTFLQDNFAGFEITDTGIGIEPSKIDSLFEFGKSEKGSSGMGLYYCRMFIEKNSGTLEITSPGREKGATVRAVFSLKEAADEKNKK